MSQVSPINPLDLKTQKSSSPSRKKGKDDSFAKELNEKQKKGKSSDREELSAHHQASQETRSSQNKFSQEKNAQKTNKSDIKVEAPASESISQKTVVPSLPVEAQNNIPQETGKVVPQISALQAENATLSPLLTTVQPALSEGSISLEGMTLINPQEMTSLIETEVTADTEATTADGGNELSAALAALTDLAKDSSKDQGMSEEGSQYESLASEQLGDALKNVQGNHLKNKEVQFNEILKATQTAPTQQTHEANMENIIQSARTLMRDGGGEMQIILNPEGLGQVDLKVGVQDSGVHIEILTKDDHVKKMFEDGLADIRGALESQNLKVDTFKVDISHKAEQNFMDQQQEQMNREFARDFLNQFRGERQGLRNQVLGYDLEKSPNMSHSPEGLHPVSRPSAMNSNGRLNIIA
ncbi:MAG: flagellar hook-length control protein FliK [Bdellovibrionaceae bacterium]|nr:flagellar hook-length control protein FliK [Pseudobdellovibrionaceae bacterium]